MCAPNAEWRAFGGPHARASLATPPPEPKKLPRQSAARQTIPPGQTAHRRITESQCMLPGAPPRSHLSLWLDSKRFGRRAAVRWLRPEQLTLGADQVGSAEARRPLGAARRNRKSRLVALSSCCAIGPPKPRVTPVAEATRFQVTPSDHVGRAVSQGPVGGRCAWLAFCPCLPACALGNLRACMLRAIRRAPSCSMHFAFASMSFVGA